MASVTGSRGPGFTFGAVAAAVVFVIGVAARIRVYARDLPVNHDEGLLRLALERWTPKGWLTPLPFEQTAGPLYLGILHAVAGTGPHAEYSYRLISLIASLLLLPVFFLSVRFLRPGWTAPIATALLALHSGLIIYAGMFKQYETDVLVTTLVFAMAAFLKRRNFGSAAWWIILPAGCLCILLSQPAIIMLCCLLVRSFFAPVPVSVWRWIALCGLAWLTLEGILYVHLYATVAASPYMRSFWTDSYVRVGDTSGWLHAMHSLFDESPGGAIPGLVLALLGTAAIFAGKERSSFILAGLPVLGVIVLAILHLYPVAPRVWMFLSPPVAFLAAIGAESVGAKAARLLPGYTRLAFTAVLALVCGAVVLSMHGRTQLLNSVFPAARILRYPVTAAKVRRTVHTLLAKKSCDPIYVAARAAPSWYFYASAEPLEGADRYAFLEPVMRRNSPAFGDAEQVAVHLPNLAPQFDLRVGCREEVYGLASGTPYRNFLPQEGRISLPGWEQNEIDRMLAPGRSGFFLYLESTGPFESQPLLDELTKRHFRYWALDPSVSVFRVDR